MDGDEKLDDFISKLKSGADLHAESPILALRNFLFVPSGTVMKDHIAISAFMVAWYKYKDGSRCKLLKLPIVLPQWRTKIEKVAK
jgi:hypothetical protein